ncbi:RE1-silencing transcription factor [Protopterus annectens]|uniref:RE1-silencing transcription factor n=1 Tax=Protopterus annectens TaxID=7888 RepID=UPI001CFA60B7|nr:RE1-silencing transcription factor [Protopterus annectens]
MATQVLGQSTGCSMFSQTGIGVPLNVDVYDLNDLSKPELCAPQLIMLANVALTGEVGTCDCLGEDKQMTELKTVGNSFSESEEEEEEGADEMIAEQIDALSGTVVPETVNIHQEHLEDDPVLPDDCSNASKDSAEVETDNSDEKSKTKSKPFRCKPCQYEAESEKEFVHHIRVHSAKKFIAKENAEKQAQSTSDPEPPAEEGDFSKGPIRCNRCGYNTNRYDHYLAHLKHHNKAGDNESVYKCIICTYTTVSEYHWKKHLRNHFPRKVYSCSQCSYFSDRKNNYIQHIRTHTGERPYQCSMCPYSSSQKTHLTRHMRTHSGEKPFKCDQCSYVASNQHEVTRHARQVHNGPKPLTCPHCDYKTADRSNFKKHVELHVNPRQFLCPVCDYAASKKCNLQYHIKSRHSDCSLITMDVSKVKLRTKKNEPESCAPNNSEHVEVDQKKCKGDIEEKKNDKTLKPEKKETSERMKNRCGITGQVATGSQKTSCESIVTSCSMQNKATEKSGKVKSTKRKSEQVDSSLEKEVLESETPRKKKKRESLRKVSKEVQKCKAKGKASKKMLSRQREKQKRKIFNDKKAKKGSNTEKHKKKKKKENKKQFVQECQPSASEEMPEVCSTSNNVMENGRCSLNTDLDTSSSNGFQINVEKANEVSPALLETVSEYGEQTEQNCDVIAEQENGETEQNKPMALSETEISVECCKFVENPKENVAELACQSALMEISSEGQNTTDTPFAEGLVEENITSVSLLDSSLHQEHPVKFDTQAKVSEDLVQLEEPVQMDIQPDVFAKRNAPVEESVNPVVQSESILQHHSPLSHSSVEMHQSNEFCKKSDLPMNTLETQSCSLQEEFKTQYSTYDGFHSGNLLGESKPLDSVHETTLSDNLVDDSGSLDSVQGIPLDTLVDKTTSVDPFILPGEIRHMDQNQMDIPGDILPDEAVPLTAFQNIPFASLVDNCEPLDLSWSGIRSNIASDHHCPMNAGSHTYNLPEYSDLQQSEQRNFQSGNSQEEVPPLNSVQMYVEPVDSIDLSKSTHLDQQFEPAKAAKVETHSRISVEELTLAKSTHLDQQFELAEVSQIEIHSKTSAEEPSLPRSAEKGVQVDSVDSITCASEISNECIDNNANSLQEKPTESHLLYSGAKVVDEAELDEDEGIHSHESSDISDNLSEGSDDSGLNGAHAVPESVIGKVKHSTDKVRVIQDSSYTCIFCDRAFTLEEEYSKHLNRHLVNVYYLKKAANGQE